MSVGRGFEGPKRYQKGAKPEPATGMAEGDAKGALSTAGGHWLSRIGDAFPCVAWDPTITRMHVTVVTLQLSRLCLPDNHTARQGHPLGTV